MQQKVTPERMQKSGLCIQAYWEVPGACDGIGGEASGRGRFQWQIEQAWRLSRSGRRGKKSWRPPLSMVYATSSFKGRGLCQVFDCSSLWFSKSLNIGNVYLSCQCCLMQSFCSDWKEGASWRRVWESENIPLCQQICFLLPDESNLPNF